MKAQNKTQIVNVRCTPGEVRVLDQAAKLSRRGRSEFLRHIMWMAANAVIDEHKQRNAANEK